MAREKEGKPRGRVCVCVVFLSGLKVYVWAGRERES